MSHNKFSYIHNAICKIDLNLGKDIIDNDYETISTIYKNSENLYCLVKWISKSYNFQYSRNMGRYVIKYGELVYDAVYLNSLANFKQWYTATEKNEVIFFCPAEYCYFYEGKSIINKSCYYSR